ncbi:Hypothetical predicted protein [Paramuricea clavata]|uniref:DUF5641 domain-containing protein n=1 Tax=Paramuricea clavata TaxID=317549 RepID=A0A6S7JBV1_PARCT|nr:Hypothetical predicted protein [Paramuricea clavata]
MLRKCVVCTRVQGLPMRAPPSPDLPDFRVDHSGPAFQATGLDFTGPLFVKGDSKHEKTYILLLIGTTSRAIHLGFPYVSDDDLDDALTPHHPIHGRNAFKQPKATDFVPSMDLEKCKRRLLHVRKTKGENTRRISVGDVVLIKDDELSVRTQWRMGKVLELVKGRDGQIRGAKLKALSKTGKQTAVFRPLQRLIPFEINENHDCTSKQQPKESKDSVDKDENVNEAAVTVNEETSAKRPTERQQ